MRPLLAPQQAINRPSRSNISPLLFSDAAVKTVVFPVFGLNFRICPDFDSLLGMSLK